MQLTYPWFLFGLLAVAVPVIIHLLQLRRPQRILFTNTIFIRQAELITVRQRKVQHLLLLLLRVLGLAALVLAFCQPFLGDASHKQEVGTVDVVVDATASMQVAGSTGLLKEEAVEGARSLDKIYPTTTSFRLINQSRQSLSRTSYLEKAADLKGDKRATLLAKLKSEVTTSMRGGSPLYLFSDFQKTTFTPQALEQFKTGREVILVPQAANPVANIYVDSVWIDDAFIRMKANVGLHIRLHNGGSQDIADCPVKVFLGERQVAAFQTAVLAGKSTASVVQIRLVDEKLALGRVVTEDAAATFDNTYRFTLQPAAAINILEIGEEPVAKQLYRNEPFFIYSFAKPQSIDYGVLRRANMVLVREVTVVDAGLRNGLRDVVKRGGSVIVVPSPIVAAQASYQQLFRDLGLGSVQWEKNAATLELREVAMPSVYEPFFRDVFGAQQRAVTMPRVAPVLRWSRTGTDILRLRDGESYLADFASGAGRVYVFSAPFTKEYSDFMAHALFVPVLYRMAMLSYRDEQLPAYRLAQGTVHLTLPSTAATSERQADEAGFRLVKDSLVLIPTQRVQGQEVRLDLPADMAEPGFYQVQQHGKVLTTLAFNEDKRESELAAYSAAELRELLGPSHPNVRVLENGAPGATLQQLQAAHGEQPLWRYFVALALACLLAESLLVRFGRRTAGVPKPALVA